MTVDQITGHTVGETIDDPQDDRLRAVPTVGPLEFVNAKFDRHGTDEYIRLFVDRDRRQLRLYRRVDGDPGAGEFIRTIVDGVGISTNNVVNGEPEAYNLHYRHAQSVLTWLALFAKERSEMAAIRFEYWGETGKTALEGTGVGEESIDFSYRTETGREFHTQIADTYTAKSVMMARHP